MTRSWFSLADSIPIDSIGCYPILIQSSLSIFPTLVSDESREITPFSDTPKISFHVGISLYRYNNSAVRTEGKNPS